MASLGATNTNEKVTLNASIANTVYGGSGVAGVLQNVYNYRLSGNTQMVPGVVTDELRAHTFFNSTFYANTSVSNPGAGTILFHLFCNTGGGCTKQVTPVRMRISCVATTPTQCDFQVQQTSALGVTCSTPVQNGMFLGGSGTSVVTLQNSCTTPPVAVANSFMFREFLATNQTAVIDLTGFAMTAAASGGFEIQNITAITTGTMTVTLEWAEE
jgi:hypothetical protein